GHGSRRRLRDPRVCLGARGDLRRREDRAGRWGLHDGLLPRRPRLHGRQPRHDGLDLLSLRTRAGGRPRRVFRRRLHPPVLPRRRGLPCGKGSHEEPVSTFTTPEPSLSELLAQIESGEVQLPDFQRTWVWDNEHIRSLLASVSLAYPIGAVMLLRAGGKDVR